MFFKLYVLFVGLNIIHGYRLYYSSPDEESFETWWYRQQEYKQSQQLKYKDNEKVKVQVYYETLCPFSIDFYTEAFNTTVNELAPYLDIQTIPYGNAKTNIDKNGKVTFRCQHGPYECYGNALHACAIDALGMTTTAVIYNSCMMSRKQSSGRSDDSAADTCGKLFNVDSTAIKACAKGDKGIKLLKYYGDETEKGYNKLGVPSILINGQQLGERDDFKTAVCQTFKNPPNACQ